MAGFTAPGVRRDRALRAACGCGRGRPPHWDGPALVRRAGKAGREVARRAGIERVDPRPSSGA
ncbi:hypothetical protein FM076_05865 [Streptomyces albus subsp. chlorinus]|nr:hypothetical protein [Streptomyces albus subsp. chlorinus]